MRYLSVCSGIEAASVAWKPLGWECAGVSEIDKFPRAVLEHRLGAVPVDDDHRWQPGQNFTPLFGDFTKIEAHHVGPIDLLVGGTPCQSFSIAGKRLGLDDPRGNLTLEYLALARRVGARWILWENVPGILSHDEGRTFGTFLGLVGECGFRWAYRVIDAQYARVGRFGRAVPQRRRRVFVVGYSGTADINPAAVLFDRESLRGNPAPRRQAGEGIATDVAPSLVSSGRGVERSGETRGQDPVVAVHDWPAEVAPTLNAAFGSKLGLEDQHVRGGRLIRPRQLPTRSRRGCTRGSTRLRTKARRQLSSTEAGSMMLRSPTAFGPKASMRARTARGAERRSCRCSTPSPSKSAPSARTPMLGRMARAGAMMGRPTRLRLAARCRRWPCKTFAAWQRPRTGEAGTMTAAPTPSMRWQPKGWRLPSRQRITAPTRWRNARRPCALAATPTVTPMQVCRLPSLSSRAAAQMLVPSALRKKWPALWKLAAAEITGRRLRLA